MKKTDPEEAKKHAEMAKQGKTFLRVVGSLVFGFFFSSLAAVVLENTGFMESIGVFEITFGSKWMLALWSLGTVLFWLHLTRKERRKAAS